MIKEKMIGMNKHKEYKTWRKSIEKDGISKSVSVEECENGFVKILIKENNIVMILKLIFLLKTL